MRYLILLDIDGTIAPYSKPSSNVWNDFTSAMINGTNIIYSPQLLKELTQIASTENVHFYWLTNWFDHATEFFSVMANFPIGKTWDYLTANGDYIEWKFDAIQELVFKSSKNDIILLIDDDSELILSHGVLEIPHNNFSAITPNSQSGLTLENINQIKALLQ